MHGVPESYPILSRLVDAGFARRLLTYFPTFRQPAETELQRRRASAALTSTVGPVLPAAAANASVSTAAATVVPHEIQMSGPPTIDVHLDEASRSDDNKEAGEELSVLESFREAVTGDGKYTTQLKNRGYFQLQFTQTMTEYVMAHPPKSCKGMKERQQQRRRSFPSCIMEAMQTDIAKVVADLIVRARARLYAAVRDEGKEFGDLDLDPVIRERLFWTAIPRR